MLAMPVALECCRARCSRRASVGDKTSIVRLYYSDISAPMLFATSKVSIHDLGNKGHPTTWRRMPVAFPLPSPSSGRFQVGLRP